MPGDGVNGIADVRVGVVDVAEVTNGTLLWKSRRYLGEEHPA